MPHEQRVRTSATGSLHRLAALASLCAVKRRGGLSSGRPLAAGPRAVIPSGGANDDSGGSTLLQCDRGNGSIAISSLRRVDDLPSRSSTPLRTATGLGSESGGKLMGLDEQVCAPSWPGASRPTRDVRGRPLPLTRERASAVTYRLPGDARFGRLRVICSGGRCRYARGRFTALRRFCRTSVPD